MTTSSAEGTIVRRRVPGEEGVWVLILGEMSMFGVFFALYLDARSEDRALFAASQEHLDLGIGLVNTVLLLTSSWLVLQAVTSFRGWSAARPRRMLGLAGLCGLAFLGGKVVEYGVKLHAGITPATDPFFMYYYVLTGIHAFHVVVGLSVLAFLHRALRHPARRPRLMTVEASASYWHMVDVLWIVLFPLLYLI